MINDYERQQELIKQVDLLLNNENLSTESFPVIQSWEDFYVCMQRFIPSVYNEGVEFRSFISKQLRSYRLLLSCLSNDCLPNDWVDRLKIIDKYILCIKDSLDLYYKGMFSASFVKLKEILNTLPVMFATTNNELYRLRVAKDNEKIDHSGMFHILLNKREVISTQRFSAPGYPCLYLGSSVYVSWKETGKPQYYNTYCSFYRQKESFPYLYLGIPHIRDMKDPKMKESVFNTSLLYFPLTVASLVRVRQPEKPFKPEYIIPQMIMQWIIENYYASDTVKERRFIGVCYTSTNIEYNIVPGVRSSLFHNLAIPAFHTTETDYSEVLRKSFEYSEPVLLSNIDMSKSDDSDFRRCLTLAAEMSRQSVKML